MTLAQAMRVYSPLPEMHFFIKKEAGKNCVHSHQTGKNFGCYESLEQAKKRLSQMKRFRAARDVKAEDYYGPNTGGMGPSKALGDPE